MLNERRFMEEGTVENTESGSYIKEKEAEEQSDVEERESISQTKGKEFPIRRNHSHVKCPRVTPQNT